MARNGGKFSFPKPGRKMLRKPEKEDDAASTPSAHEWPSRLDEPTSKAHRILGTSEPIYRTTSKQSSVPPSPGFMSITVSEASYGSDIDDRASRAATDRDGRQLRPVVSRRPSSNVMGRAYSGDGHRGSEPSINSHRLHNQASNSTMRSHYDAKSSPLAISQQTSDSAVRDMALRRGKPQVVAAYGSNTYSASPVSPVILQEANNREHRKSKPARLDLSRLFPRPKTGEGRQQSKALLSPTKMVNSPAAMSTTSDFPFPRPMTREPTPNPRGPVQLKPTDRPHASVPPTPSSPVRLFRRDEYDSAKVNVRRPPKGVKHWFDALDEDSDEALDDSKHPIFAPKAVRLHGPPRIPSRHASADQLRRNAALPPQDNRGIPAPRRKDTFTHEDLISIQQLTCPSQYSLASNKTKESALSKTNLQDSSVLSFSSSEDEFEDHRIKSNKASVCEGLDMHYDAGDMIIEQAQAFEVRPRRRPSATQMSMRSTSTGAATIEVMYTPEPPFTSMYYPRNSQYSSSRRSSHVRQPSIIHEDEDSRPKTAAPTPLSTSSHSIRSARTSTSEPKSRSDGTQKMMVVTAEEEMLLELMRKKRALMAKTGQSTAEMFAEEHGKKHTPLADKSRKPYRTSGFLAEASPVRVLDNNSGRKAPVVQPSPLHLTPRGRPRKAHYDDSNPRDSSTSDAWYERHNSSLSHSGLPLHLPTPSEFSPIDIYIPMSPVPSASVTSPTTVDHPSPLPSPITPGLRTYETDLNVKVASSDTSTISSEEVTVLDSGVIDPPLHRIKSCDTSGEIVLSHQRRRTASSGADVSFPVPPTHGLTDLTPVSESSSRPPSIIEPPLPKLPAKHSRRVSTLTPSTNDLSRSRQSSVHSVHSQQSATSQSSGYLQSVDKRSSKRVSRQLSATSISTKRNSVSDDVLAAWNSLGGTI